MTINEQKKLIALFFFYSLMDEELAVQASRKTVSTCFKNLKNIKDNDSARGIDTSQLVYQTHKIWVSFKDKKLIQRKGNLGESYWQLPPNLDLGLWRHFLRDNDPEEYLTLIWSKILLLSDECISNGLGITMGTVRHRLGRGLKKLGSMMTMT